MKNQLVNLLLQTKPLIRTITVSILFTFSLAAVALETSMAQHRLIDNETTSSQSNEQTAWVDVRSWLEYQIDHIDGDPRVPVSDIVEGVSELYPDKNTQIRLYCAAGVRAGTATNALIAAGYTNVQNAGGIEDVRALRNKKSD